MKKILEFKNIFILLILIICLVNTKAYWDPVTLPSQYRNVYFLDIKFLPNDLNYGWACGYNGTVVRTTDGGKTWTGNQSAKQEQFESINFIDKNVGFVSGAGALYKTLDGGASWNVITPQATQIQVLLWGNYFLDANVGMVVGGDCQTGRQYFFKTTNGGASWNLAQNIRVGTKLADVLLRSANGEGYAASSGIMWKTTDGGSNWNELSQTGGLDWHEDFSISGNSILVCYAKSCDGSINIGIGEGGGRISTDMGKTWSEFESPASMFGATLIDSQRGWICGLGAYAYYTSNAGKSWELKNCGIPSGTDLDNVWTDGKDALWLCGRGYIFKWKESTADTTIVEALTPVEVCEGDTVVLNCKNDFKYYIWSNGASTKTIKVTESGRYSVLGRNHECETGTPDSIDVIVTSFINPKLKADKTSGICDGDTVTLSVGSLYASYKWSTGDTTPTIKVTKSGTYSLSIVSLSGCPGKDSIKVKFAGLPKPNIFANRTNACQGDSVKLNLTESLSSYKWYKDGVLMSGAPEVYIKEGGNFRVVVTNSSGCPGEDTVSINFRQDSNIISVRYLQANDILDMGSGTYEKINCSKLHLLNKGAKPAILDNIYMFYKFAFSIPTSQFPIVLQPGDSADIDVCYSPTKFEIQRDTIVLPDVCSDHYIPVVCKGYGQNYTVESNCGVFVKLTAYDVQKGTKFVANSPYPNPSTGKTKALVSAFAKTPEDFKNAKAEIFDLFGEKQADAKFVIEETQFDADGVFIYGYVDIDASALKQGVYFTTISFEEQTYRYKLVIQ